MLGSRFDLSEALNEIAEGRSISENLHVGYETGIVEIKTAVAYINTEAPEAAAPILCNDDFAESAIAEPRLEADLAEDGMNPAEAPLDLIDEHCVQLEREMIEVAHTLHSSNMKIAVFCPVCDARMAVRDECDIEEDGGLEIKLHRLECTDCGMATGRVFHPAIGYHQIPTR